MGVGGWVKDFRGVSVDVCGRLEVLAILGFHQDLWCVVMVEGGVGQGPVPLWLVGLVGLGLLGGSR